MKTIVGIATPMGFGGVGKNGISYLLDMGEPIKIVDIAEQIIRISGYEPYKDIDIQFIGLRKGERLDEPLWTKDEDPKPTEHSKILQLKPDTKNPPESYSKLIEDLYPICFKTENSEDLYRNRDILIQILIDAVPSLKKFYEGK